MNFTKGVLVFVTLALLGYAGYQLYEHAVEDATQRIKAGAAQGVREGARGILNPFKLIGIGRKK